MNEILTLWGGGRGKCGGGGYMNEILTLWGGGRGKCGGGVITYMSYMGRSRGLAPPPFLSQSPALLGKVSDSL